MYTLSFFYIHLDILVNMAEKNTPIGLDSSTSSDNNDVIDVVMKGVEDEIAMAQWRRSFVANLPSIAVEEEDEIIIVSDTSSDYNDDDPEDDGNNDDDDDDDEQPIDIDTENDVICISSDTDSNEYLECPESDVCVCSSSIDDCSCSYCDDSSCSYCDAASSIGPSSP